MLENLKSKDVFMIKPITKTSMYMEIVDQMITRIKEGEWEPNSQLPTEIELAKAFNVSRNSIREALKSLVMFGIIYARPGLGTFIAKDALQKVGNTELLEAISEEASIEILMETRLIIEPQLSRLAALRATDKDKKNLVEALELLNKDLNSRLMAFNKAKKALKAADTDALIMEELQEHSNPSVNGIRFHMCVAETAKNIVLAKFLQSIKGELEKQRSRLYFKDSQDIETMLEDHIKICDAIVSNDQDRAGREMYQHLLNGYKNMIKAGEKTFPGY